MRRILSKDNISDAFASVIGGGGGDVQECSVCGRIHYAVNSTSFSSDEILNLEESNKVDPDSYIAVNNDSVEYWVFDGNVVPVNCPCNGLKRYEDFMWNHRKLWSTFLMNKKLMLQNEIDSIEDIKI